MLAQSCVLSCVLVACGRPTEPAPVATGKSADAPTVASAKCAVERPRLAPGLVHEQWAIGATPIAGAPCIDVVRGDLAQYRLRALTDPAGRTAPAWRDREHLAAVINAGMFHQGGAPVGLVVADGSVHGVDNASFGGFVAWDPVDPKDAAVIATGRECAGFDLAKLRVRYRSLVQSYRLLACDGGALAWKDAKRYSAAAIGVDRAGRVVFLHARGAVTMGELAIALAGHDLAGAIFLEGGPEASLIAGDLALLGSYETGFIENDDNREFWALPNVIGLVPRSI